MKTFIVDSFTREAFKGNPAGVCLTEIELKDSQMLAIAQELGLSETAFVQKSKQDNQYAIRFFSPKMEIPLCGHATLASAKVIFESLGSNHVSFTTIQHIQLRVTRVSHEIVMEFPVYETEPATAPPALLEALGLQNLVNCAYNKETHVLLLEILNSDILRNLQPDYSALAKSHDSIHGVVVTCPSQNPMFDFESRFFWPWSGTNEDPVTGGTHTFLTKYWSAKLNKTRMKSFQASDRTGFMEVELISDSKMTIKSEAVIIFEGQLRIF